MSGRHRTVYWGTGYHTDYFGLGDNGDNGDSNWLYALTLNGHRPRLKPAR